MNKSDLFYHKNITLEQAMTGGNFYIHLENEKKVKVHIAPDINDGQIVRLKEMGQMNETGNRGDVFIELKIMDHPLYKLHGLDIHAVLVLSPVEAALGCSKTLPGPDGKKLTVKVPEKSKHGDIVIVENEGIKKNDKIGDIHFELLLEDINAFDAIFDAVLLSNSSTSLN
jgi:curved DNA-binding protein